MTKRSELEAARAHGDLVGLVETARSNTRQQQPSRVRDRLLCLLPDVALPGGLSTHPELASWLLAACAQRGETPKAAAVVCTPLPDSIGHALFPVAEATDQGRLLMLEVGWRDALGPPPDTGDDFRGAVETARRCAFRAARCDDTEGASALSWRVTPLPRDAGPLEGDSVGLAALVAWTSWLHRTAPLTRRAYSGRLVNVGGRYEVKPVAPSTLAAKALAIDRIDPGIRVLLPGENANQWGGRCRAEAFSGVSDVWRLFPAGVRETSKRLGVGVCTRARVELDPEALATLAVLSASLTPMNDDTLEHLVEETLSRGAHDRRGQVHLPSILERLQSLDLCVSESRTITPRGEAHIDLDRAPRWCRAAHGALAASQRLPLAQQLAHHLRTGVDTGPACAAEALRGALEVDTVASLAQLAQFCDEHRPDHVIPIATVLMSAPAVPDPAASLAALMLVGLELPPPLSATARAVIRGETWVEWLLGTQALFELVLHFVTEVASATGHIGADSAARLSDRPSMGLLRKALIEFVGPNSPTDQSAKVVWAALRASDDASRLATDLELATRTLNELHSGTGLTDLVLPGSEAAARDRLGIVAPAIYRLVQAVTRGLRGEASLGTSEQHGHLALQVRDATCPLVLTGTRSHQNSGVAERGWRRGTIGGHVRWWSFSSSFSSGGPPPPVATGGAPPPSPGDLPLPLARVAIGALKTRRDGGSPLARLSAIDLALGVLLRLANAPSIAVAAAQPQARLSDKGTIFRALSRGNHRNHHALLLDPASPQTPLSDALRGALNGHLLHLIDGVERHQHAPGPLSSWEPAVRSLDATLDDLLARIARDNLAEFVLGEQSLTGPDMPRGLNRTNAPQDLAALWPMFGIADGKLAFLVDAALRSKGARRRQLAHGTASYRPLSIATPEPVQTGLPWPWARGSTPL
jgi:hypothetical protein